MLEHPTVSQIGFKVSIKDFEDFGHFWEPSRWPIGLISSGFQLHISTTEPESGGPIGPLHLELEPHEHQI